MTMSYKGKDWELAHRLQNQEVCFGVTENAVFPDKKNKENYQPRTLVDHTLELIDPTPNIHTLFVQFNVQFFWSKLVTVEVKWSNRMTSCAGTCSFHPRNKECVITLSAPLLRLRPRKDLVETLLHEMIHGYLFLTNSNRDRDGHGPEFQKHMKRINQEAGTNITIYHNFHDEVRLYQQHWWRCNGPCQYRAPYFGMVRRASNRVPSKNDYWWGNHQRTCGGQFIKVKEPKKSVVNSKKKNNTSPVSSKEKASMSGWLIKGNDSKSNLQSTADKDDDISNVFKKLKKTSSLHSPFKKLGNSTNKVYGWGTRGPGLENQNDLKTISTSDSRFSGSGKLGGSNTGRSILLDKFLNLPSTSSQPDQNLMLGNKSIMKSKTNVHTNTLHSNVLSSASSHCDNIPRKTPCKKRDCLIENFLIPSASLTQNEHCSKSAPDSEKVSCPICHNFVPKDTINSHLDLCLEKNVTNKGEESKQTQSTVEISNTNCVNCPSCDTKLLYAELNNHLDQCLTAVKNPLKRRLSEVLEIPDFPLEGKKCLVCNSVINADTTLSDHLEDCVGNIFKDETIVIDSSDDETHNESKNNVGNQCPCPVCMEMVDEIYMNNHLDCCLTKR